MRGSRWPSSSDRPPPPPPARPPPAFPRSELSKGASLGRGGQRRIRIVGRLLIGLRRRSPRRRDDRRRLERRRRRGGREGTRRRLRSRGGAERPGLALG